MKRVLVIATFLQACFCGSVFACGEPQKGNVIFEDNFADDSGGWQRSDSFSIEPPAFVITLDKNSVAAQPQNLTFDVNNGDFCVDVVLPPSPPESNVSGGLIFWGSSDLANYYVFIISPNSAASLWRKTNGNWTQILSGSASVKPTEANSVRAVAKGNLITLFVNGQEFKKIQAQNTGGSRFGMYVEADKAPTDPIKYKFQNYKVTAGE
jgi:hypothetical protein